MLYDVSWSNHPIRCRHAKTIYGSGGMFAIRKLYYIPPIKEGYYPVTAMQQSEEKAEEAETTETSENDTI